MRPVKDGPTSRNASPSLGKIPLGSGVKDASPTQGNAPVVAVATNDSWQRAIERSKRNRPEQLQQLQRRGSKEEESPTASAVKRELSAQISSQSTNKNKTPREASKRSVSPNLIAASDHHNHILREHERLLQSLQQSLSDVELSVCNKDSPAFMSVSQSERVGADLRTHYHHWPRELLLRRIPGCAQCGLPEQHPRCNIPLHHTPVIAKVMIETSAPGPLHRFPSVEMLWEWI
jgi:hypothetical protein